MVRLPSLKLFITLFLVIGFFGGVALAADIDNMDRWAWNDLTGWIDFYGHPGINRVQVENYQLKQYAFFYSNSSDIALDCATSPNGNICSTSNFFVSNDGSGKLAGWAWSDTYGWISFCGNASGGSTYNGSTWVCPASPTYQVKISPNNGDFSGWAWNEVIGWISFNCNNSGIGNTCSTSNYKVNTKWHGCEGCEGGSPLLSSGSLESSTFDAGFSDGVVFNSIMWLGTSGTGGVNIVKFQIATANCPSGATNPSQCTSSPGWGGSKTSGDGAFVGSDGTSATYYQPSGPRVPVAVSTLYHNNKRYFRYRVFLEKDTGVTTPVVQDIIINWSP